ncbi:steroid delta-isomerase-like uncharacterized protein [Hoeflea marina]|uniref:Steroid delta-isomerase-like uncharacterized protein n=1 Tax=Hoeflea marina TaxID=274592 RepID=A0A317PFW7_9HYPH|nr:ketosteroid isomerase-related protein [Hoeflea marina]PWV97684.1 steroid delta-isomerase-like uncharacterized protein [Hoeflea marina]
MTAQSTAALIRRYLDAFNARDFDAMLACLSEDVVHDINQGGREIGRDAFRWFNARMAEHYEETLGDIVVMVDDSGHHAAAEFTVRGRYLKTDEGLPEATGQSYSLTAGIFFEVEDGAVTRVSTTYNLPAWIAQVQAG